jgi:hypothetical protein
MPLALLVLMLALVSARSRTELEGLREHGVSTTGSVTGGECSDHGEIEYRFMINSREYGGVGFCPVDCNTVKPGAAVPVLYDGRDPGTSICEPLQRVLGRVQRFFAPLIAGGVVTVGGIFWFTRRRAPRIVKAK